MENLLAKAKEAATYVKTKTTIKPHIGLILGSGLGVLADEITDAVHINYDEIPHFPTSTVEGHAGKLVIGSLNGVHVLCMQGRFHFYEGYSMQEVTFPVRLMKLLGINQIIVTNACGGMNANFQPGDLMLITDHLNMTGTNPLIGTNNEEFGPRFPDMSKAYTPELIEIAKEKAKENNIKVQTGVYAGITGPAYCTPAELIMLRKLGGDAVGMSTVPEVIVASHMSMKVLGISCVTDMAIGEELEPLSHEQVVAVAKKTKPKFIELVKSIVQAI